MKAVIMAGGRGTRLTSVTGDIPKPMVRIAGRPLLEYQVENLRENGIRDIIMVTGYLGNVIRDYFGDGSLFGVSISYYVEDVPLGTAGAMRELKDNLREDFLLVFGDLFFDVDFVCFQSFHKEKKSLITLFTHPNSHPYDSDILVTDESGRVTEWSLKNTERRHDYRNLVNAGLYVISGRALEYLPGGQNGSSKIDLEKELIIPLISTGEIYAYHSTEYVKDIGTPERLKRAEEDCLKGICEKRNRKNRQKCIFLDRDGTINRYVGFLRDVSQVELEDCAAEAIRLINESEYLAVVVTNQPVIARGECSFEMLEQIHNRIHTLLGEKGAFLDGIYFCPHHTDRGFEGEVPELKTDCNCRKPKTGMLMQAAEELNIDMENSWMIGDSGIDIQTGRNAGIRTGLVMTGESDKFRKFDVCADITAGNLLECVERIVQSGV